MTLQERVDSDLKEAMRAKDTKKLGVLRMLKAALKYAAIAKSGAEAELSDVEAAQVVRKQVKQRQDSIESFENGGRPELAAKEKEDWIWGGAATLPGAHDRAILRLSRGGSDAVEAAGLRLDPATHEVRRGESQIQLSAKEFALLETFMRRPGEVLSRLHLLEHAWDFAYDNRSNVVDVHVRRLRRKIDEPFGRRSLETIRGAGYRLRSDGGT